jgi:hypothetical protein
MEDIIVIGERFNPCEHKIQYTSNREYVRPDVGYSNKCLRSSISWCSDSLTLIGDGGYSIVHQYCRSIPCNPDIGRLDVAMDPASSTFYEIKGTQDLIAINKGYLHRKRSHTVNKGIEGFTRIERHHNEILA